MVNIPNAPRYRTPATQTIYASGSANRLKKDDIGTFDPGYKDPDDLGVISNGRNTIYTNVYTFIKRIKDYIEDKDNGPAFEKQIKTMFRSLMAGAALNWYQRKLKGPMKRLIKKAGLREMLSMLEKRFELNSAKATQRWQDANLTLKDIHRNEEALPNYIHKKLRYA
jgi:hypothetical protein